MTITTTALQTIINHAETISIDRRRSIGIQYTKSEIANVTEIITRLPWQFKVKTSAYFDYADPATRRLLEQLDYMDRRYPETVSFANNSNLSYFFAYQGDMTALQQAAVTVTSFAGTTLTIGNVEGLISGQYVVRQGDFLQIQGFPYPFTAVSDVEYTGASSYTITTHRPNFMAVSNGYTNQHINFGNAVQFKMLCSNTPTYSFVTAYNTAAIVFDSEFQLYEYTGPVTTNINEVVTGGSGGIL